VGYALRSSDLLHVEASQARVSQFASKLADAQRWVVRVASSRRICEDKVKDGQVDTMGCVGPYYHYFTVFFVLCARGILVFYLGL
jgi:hypothetical protein